MQSYGAVNMCTWARVLREKVNRQEIDLRSGVRRHGTRSSLEQYSPAGTRTAEEGEMVERRRGEPGGGVGGGGGGGGLRDGGNGAVGRRRTEEAAPGGDGVRRRRPPESREAAAPGARRRRGRLGRGGSPRAEI